MSGALLVELVGTAASSSRRTALAKSVVPVGYTESWVAAAWSNSGTHFSFTASRRSSTMPSVFTNTRLVEPSCPLLATVTITHTASRIVDDEEDVDELDIVPAHIQ